MRVLPAGTPVGLPADLVAQHIPLPYDSSNYQRIVVRQAAVIAGGLAMDHGSMHQLMTGMGGNMMGGGFMWFWVVMVVVMVVVLALLVAGAIWLARTLT